MRADDERNRAEAERIERENPEWIVVFGIYTRQFICFPKFNAPRGTVLVAPHPAVLPVLMRNAEPRQLHRQEPDR